MGDTETCESARLVRTQKRLQETMLNLMPDEGEYSSTLLPGFRATRREQSAESYFRMSGPTVGMVIQGSRYVVCNGVRHECHAFGCFLDSGNPVQGIYRALVSPKRPYLSITLDVDATELGRLGKNIPADVTRGISHSWIGCAADIHITDAFLRLARLVKQPQLFFMLAPFIVKEIHYRVLVGISETIIRPCRNRVN